MIRILPADDHLVVRMGLAAFTRRGASSRSEAVAIAIRLGILAGWRPDAQERVPPPVLQFLPGAVAP